MGRKRHDGRGWTLRRASAEQVWYVRFRPAPGAATVERSTGCRDQGEADAAAARIVADARAGELRARVVRPRAGAATPLVDLLADWLVWLEPTHAATTRKTWEDYGAHFARFFGSTAKLTDEGCTAYQRARLAVVQGSTVRKEQTALRSLLAYAESAGAVPPGVVVPKLPKRATGKAYGVRRRTAAPQLSPDETRRLIRALPEWSASRKVDRFPIRARFVVGYETGLRPSTLDRLSAPEHYRVGSAVLRLDAASVKDRWARDVPLTRRARRVLDYVLRALAPEAGVPHKGPIFGWHNYREHLAAAAAATLPPETAERFCAAHLRSAFTTHALESGSNIVGIQYRVGHKLISTTARYVKPSFRAAEETLSGRRVGVPHNPPGRAPKGEVG